MFFAFKQLVGLEFIIVRFTFIFIYICIGTKLQFYTINLDYDSLYTMTEIVSFELPRTKEELPKMLLCLDGMIRTSFIYANCCTEASFDLKLYRYPTLPTSVNNELKDTRKSKKIRCSINFKGWISLFFMSKLGNFSHYVDFIFLFFNFTARLNSRFGFSTTIK